MNAFQFIFQYIKRHKIQYTLGIITLFVVDFANIFIPKLTGVITDGLTAHSLDWSGVRLNLLYLFLLGLLLAVGRFFGVTSSLVLPALLRRNCAMICLPTSKKWMWNITTSTRPVI